MMVIGRLIIVNVGAKEQIGRLTDQ